VKRHESLFLHTRYDAFNRRIGETVTNSAGTSTQWYVYDGQNVVLQLNAAGGVTERYLCGRAVDQVLAAENGSGVVSWLLADNQGSVRDVVQFIYGLTTNVDHISYSAYGQIAHESNASYNPGIGYTGQFWDAAAGMYYCQARWYDPSTGRYMSEDPTGFSAGDANLYRYVFNDPTNLVDPTGEVIGWSGITPMQSAILAAAFAPSAQSELAALLGNWTPNWLHRGTINVGISASISVGPITLNGSLGVIVDMHGNVGGYKSLGAGVGVGGGAMVGPTVGVSNAECITDVGGPFGQAGAQAGDVAALGGDVYVGPSAHGLVVGAEGTGGIGFGGGGWIGGNYTKVTPCFH
jgi:RHS repeat-associated protein